MESSIIDREPRQDEISMATQPPEYQAPRSSDNGGSVQLTVQDLVKCDTEGKVDWKTLGNIMTAKLLEQAHCVSFIDFKHGRMTKDFKADIDWKFAYEEEGILVFKRPSLPCMYGKKIQNNKTTSLMSFIGRGVVDCPLNDVASFISQFKYLSEWNKFMVDSKLVDVIESDSQKDKIGYFSYESTKCLEGKFVQSYISVDWPTCPSISGIPRVKVYLGTGWVLEPYEGSETKTLATYAANVDLNGPLPTIIMNRVLQRQPITIHYMQKSLMEHRRKKHEQPTKPIPLSLSEGIDSSFALTAADTLGSTTNSFVCVSRASNHYEEPTGLADFIGRRPLSIMRKSQASPQHHNIPNNYQHSQSCDYAEHHGHG